MTDAVLLEIGNALARSYKQEAVEIIEQFLAAEASVQKVWHMSVACATGAPFPVRAATAVSYRAASRLYDC